MGFACCNSGIVLARIGWFIMMQGGTVNILVLYRKCCVACQGLFGGLGCSGEARKFYLVQANM